MGFENNIHLRKRPVSICNIYSNGHRYGISPWSCRRSGHCYFEVYGKSKWIRQRQTCAAGRAILGRRRFPMLIVRSPVRISFGGGGSDLPSYYERFGGAVLNVAINKYFYTILGSRSDRSIQIISSDLRGCESWRGLSAMDIQGDRFEIPVAGA